MNTSAFPQSNDRVVHAVSIANSQGMTLRDYFAAKAMHGIIAGIDPQMNYEEIATRAYQYADAMIEVREA